MQRSFPKISQSININSRIIDQSAKDLDRALHGGIMQWSPIGLIPVVDINGNVLIFAIKDAIEVLRLVLDDGLQELLVEFVELFPVVFPKRFEDASFLSLPQLCFDWVQIDVLDFAVSWPSAFIDLLDDVLHL